MILDPDLSVRILARIEETCNGTPNECFSVDGADRDTVAYHLEILRDDGLIVGIDNSGGGKIGFDPSRLTGLGHRFLAMAREDTIWSKAKVIARAAGRVAIDTLYAAMLGEAIRKFGITP